MNAEFSALAFVAALNPKLPAADLLLIEIRRPRAMFLCVLFGAMTVALTIVLVFDADAMNSRKAMSAGIDLVLSQLLAAAGALVATGLITADHEKRRW